MVHDRLREHRCKACNHWARAPGSPKALRSRPCNPAPLQAAAAARFFALAPELHRHPSAAVAVAMDAARALEADLAAPGVEGRAGVVAVELGPVDGEAGVYSELGHQMERRGALVTCLARDAFSVAGGRNPKLLNGCNGYSTVASTRANEEMQISRAMRGLHPRSGREPS